MQVTRQSEDKITLELSQDDLEHLYDTVEDKDWSTTTQEEADSPEGKFLAKFLHLAYPYLRKELAV